MSAKSASELANPQANPLALQVFAWLLGGFLGLALLKFGNPPIMERFVSPPTNGWEFALNSPWPIAWAYALLATVVAVGLFTARWRSGAPTWLLALPLLWLVWEGLAATQTLNSGMSRPTLKHFAVCAACFYLGFFCLSRVRRMAAFWLGVLVAFLLLPATGWEQHFGGLEETRRYFFTYLYPQMKEVPPEYLKKMSSTRIWATMFYPNALAGALLLLLPPLLGFIGQARRVLTPAARGFLVVTVGLGALACLYWSGSKGGWLLMLTLGLVTLLRLPFARRLKIALVVAVLTLGLTGFFVRYAGFFKKGATSVSARFDYWRAAVQTAKARPLFGTGPGTFAIPYLQIKRPESEPTRMVHNDYLEQASDSGLPGFFAYSVFVVAALFLGYPKRSGRNAPAVPAANASPVAAAGVSRSPPPISKREGGGPGNSSSKPVPPQPQTQDWQPFWVWLGVFGWALQGIMEFGLYLPALAWPAFALLGWLLGRNTAPGPDGR